MIWMILFLWLLAILILAIKYFYVFTGEKLKGEIIGFRKGASSTMNFVGYNYVIRFAYKDDFYTAKAIQSKQNNLNRYPKMPKDRDCMIYFNPKHPKTVSMAGRYGIELISVGIILL